jgi:hypothetical protein
VEETEDGQEQEQSAEFMTCLAVQTVEAEGQSQLHVCWFCLPPLVHVLGVQTGLEVAEVEEVEDPPVDEVAAEEVEDVEEVAAEEVDEVEEVAVEEVEEVEEVAEVDDVDEVEEVEEVEEVDVDAVPQVVTALQAVAGQVVSQSLALLILPHLGNTEQRTLGVLEHTVLQPAPVTVGEAG